MSLWLVSEMGMLVGSTSNLVANEALIVMHVLRLLGRGESNGIYVHGVMVTARGG